MFVVCSCDTTTASLLPPVSFSLYVLPAPTTNLSLRSGTTPPVIVCSSVVTGVAPSHN